MPKRSPKDSSSKSSDRGKNQRRKKRGLGTLLLFWPFALWQGITSAFPTIIKIPARLIGHPAILALYALIPMSIFYYGRARQFDMAKVSEMPERSIVLGNIAIVPRTVSWLAT